jgi:hypothetical protein
MSSDSRMFVFLTMTPAPVQMITWLQMHQMSWVGDSAPVAQWKIFYSSVYQTMGPAFLAVPKQLARGTVSHVYFVVINER